MLKIIKNFKYVLPISSIKRISYREEINLLRALSVLSVVVYHANLNILNAGYLGVDIFFVISGYLISNIIISELNENSFSFKNFYLRRIKRIIPALLSTLVFTLPFSFIYLSPINFIDYTKSLVSSLFFYSNIFFNNLDFYNSVDAKLMPLLHTWSLAVEEQFYILFPLLVVFIFKVNKNRVLGAILFIFLVSFLLNQTISNEKFYLTQYRTWELLVGVIAGFVPRINVKKMYLNVPYFIILFSMYFFDDAWILDIEPKLIVTSSTFLIIILKQTEYNTFRISDNDLIKNIGKASYSIYLFHQPVFVFYRWHLKNNKLDDIFSFYIDSLFLIIFVLVISFLNYRYIEKYFMKAKEKKLNLLIPVVSSIIIFSYISFQSNGFFTQRYNMPEKVILYSDSDNYAIKQNGNFCHHSKSNSSKDICVFNEEIENKDVYIFGDSHAKLISSDIAQKIKDKKIIMVTGDSCIFLSNTIVPECARKDKEKLIGYEDQIKNSIVIYIANVWDKLDKGLDLETKIPITINNFLANNNKVIVVYQIPHFRFDILDNYYFNVTNFGDSIVVENNSYLQSENTQRSNKIYDGITSKNLFRVYPDRIFCRDIIPGFCVAAEGKNIYYEDSNHLSIEGSRLVVDKIIEILKTN